MKVLTSSTFALVSALFALGCSDDGAATEESGGGGTAGTGGSATGGTAPTGGTATGGTAGTGMIFPTPAGTLFMDDFEAGATNWDVTQGTCSIAADEGTNVYTCLQAWKRHAPWRGWSGANTAFPRASA